MHAAFALLALFLAQSQTPPGQAVPASWRQVEQIAPGTGIRVTSDLATVSCSFSTANDATLTCMRPRHLLQPGRAVTLDRSQIRVLQRSRKAASLLAVTAVGTGAGIAIGAGLDASAKTQEDGHLETAVFGILGALVGITVGTHTDLFAGPVVYRRP